MAELAVPVWPRSVTWDTPGRQVPGEAEWFPAAGLP